MRGMHLPVGGACTTVGGADLAVDGAYLDVGRACLEVGGASRRRQFLTLSKASLLSECAETQACLAVSKMAATQESTAPVPPDPVCSRHGDPLCWYRLEDEQLVCESCKASSKEGHRFWTVTHAFEERKTVLEITLQTLREKLGGSRKAHGLFVEMAHHTKTQVQQTERLIKDEFEKLQKFLQEEKESRLAALKREEGQKSQKLMQMIKEMTKEISSLSHTIKAIEKHLESEDISFLQIHNDVVEKFCKATKEKEPEVPTGALIDVAKHLGNLKYSVWEKMVGVVNYSKH
ncbi:hypothetical protein JZ751_016605 [Albula glossodonta]|uniref:B-box C-terminal domain-containing protein n=1 Tax=Albula glossodonta TaxID=121402 RepID=A0A8T2MLW4_9TELE|nr:hypothetical protein JZ751_016605 [Albula glossodonta]